MNSIKQQLIKPSIQNLKQLHKTNNDNNSVKLLDTNDKTEISQLVYNQQQKTSANKIRRQSLFQQPLHKSQSSVNTNDFKIQNALSLSMQKFLKSFSLKRTPLPILQLSLEQRLKKIEVLKKKAAEREKRIIEQQKVEKEQKKMKQEEQRLLAHEKFKVLEADAKVHEAVVKEQIQQQEQHYQELEEQEVIEKKQERKNKADNLQLRKVHQQRTFKKIIEKHEKIQKKVMKTKESTTAYDFNDLIQERQLERQLIRQIEELKKPKIAQIKKANPELYYGHVKGKIADRVEHIQEQLEEDEYVYEEEEEYEEEYEFPSSDDEDGERVKITKKVVKQVKKKLPKPKKHKEHKTHVEKVKVKKPVDSDNSEEQSDEYEYQYEEVSESEYEEQQEEDQQPTVEELEKQLSELKQRREQAKPKPIAAQKKPVVFQSRLKRMAMVDEDDESSYSQNNEDDYSDYYSDCYSDSYYSESISSSSEENENLEPQVREQKIKMKQIKKEQKKIEKKKARQLNVEDNRRAQSNIGQHADSPQFASLHTTPKHQKTKHSHQEQQQQGVSSTLASDDEEDGNGSERIGDMEKIEKSPHQHHQNLHLHQHQKKKEQKSLENQKQSLDKPNFSSSLQNKKGQNANNTHNLGEHGHCSVDVNGGESFEPFRQNQNSIKVEVVKKKKRILRMECKGVQAQMDLVRVELKK